MVWFLSYNLYLLHMQACLGISLFKFVLNIFFFFFLNLPQCDSCLLPDADYVDVICPLFFFFFSSRLASSLFSQTALLLNKAVYVKKLE